MDVAHSDADRAMARLEDANVETCLHCDAPVEYMTDRADGVDRWMHVGLTGPDDPYGRRVMRYQDCRGLVAEPRVVAEPEIDALLAVATLYVDAFKDDEAMTLPERMRLQEIEDILDRHGRRY